MATSLHTFGMRATAHDGRCPRLGGTHEATATSSQTISFVTARNAHAKARLACGCRPAGGEVL